MDIFNSNRKLEELVMFGIDWGVFLRHDLDSPIAPFMFLKNGKEEYIRVLMTDGDPLEYAKTVLQKEEKTFQQFIIGFEGYHRNDNNERVDAIIIHGFDITQEKGVSLGQMFLPKENGGFKKIDKVTYLGNPDLILPLKSFENPDYSIEEIGFNAVAFEKDNLTKYMAVFTHENPSVIANSIKRFLRSKFGGEKKKELEGTFDLEIPDGIIKNIDFLKFLVTNSINEELASKGVEEWQNLTGRSISITCKYGGNLIYETSKITPSKDIESEKKYDYYDFSQNELDTEFNRIINIPNARTNIEALIAMSELMKEYKKRGLKMPNERNTKRWWEFWK